MLLLSTPVVQTMENEKAGWMSSIRSNCSKLAQTVVVNPANALYEAAKAHPYVTAATLAAPVVGYGIYKAFQAKQVDLKAQIAEQALKDGISFRAILNGAKKVPATALLGSKLLELSGKLPVSEKALSDAVKIYANALIAFDMLPWDAKSENCQNLKQDVITALTALKQVGLFKSQPKSLKAKLADLIPSKAALKKAASAIVPSKATVKTAAFVVLPAAAIATAIAYDNGSLDNVITAGSKAATDLGKAIANIDYTGKFNAAKGFVANNPKTVGGGLVGTAAAVGAGLYLKGRIAKKAVVKPATKSIVDSKANQFKPEVIAQLKEKQKNETKQI
jgi:hypothetical protein